MYQQFIKNIRVIKAAIAERKLVVFAGAGISVDAGVPGWSELINELKEDINISSNETDFLRVAQLYYNNRHQKEFLDKIREVLKHKKLRYNEIHEEIFELNPEHIITTNLEDLLEQVIRSKAYPFSVIKKDAEFPYARNTKLLVKMHGDLDEGNLVIKEDDYLGYSTTHPLIEAFIKGIFANKIVLFIGYSFSDVNLKTILHSVQNILGKDFQNAYLLSVDEEFHPSQRQYLRNKGINVVNYYDGGNDFITSYLFRGRNALNYKILEHENPLSKKGNALLRLLKFISLYDSFSESILKENALSQMFKSLNRFNNIRVLPPKFLGNLYPFNDRKAYVHNYSDYVMGSNNEIINEFFFEDFNSETLKLNDSFFKKNSISMSQKAFLNTQLESVLQKLNYATVFYFGRTKNKPELFDYPKDLDEKINIELPSKQCNCLSCLYNQFNFKEFLKDIREQTITETSEIQNDLLIAYSNYKAGNIGLAVNQFEEIANKSWQLEEYISYYICQLNIKTLRNLLDWNFEDVNEAKSKMTVERIDKLDVDKLMLQVPRLNDDVYKLLKTIRDDEVLLDGEREINRLYDKIVDVYELYKRGGQSSGPHYPKQIIEELVKIFLFYTYNYIVRDEFRDFKYVFEKGIKALLISYSTDKTYPARFTDFDSWVIKFILFYADDKEIKETLKRYSIKELHVPEQEVEVLIKYLTNLFESIFNETKFFGREVKLDKGILVQYQNLFFQQRLRNTLYNAFLVYSLIPISEGYGKELVKKLLDFLKADEILILASDEYFNRFLKKIIQHFSFEDLIDLLKISVGKGFLIRSEEFFKIIANAIGENADNKTIEDAELIDAIIEKSINPKVHQHHRGFMHLYKVADKKNKKAISNAIKNDFTANFYSYDYFIACGLNLISPSDFYPNILIEIEGHRHKEFSIESERFIRSDTVFLNFLYMIYNKRLLRKEVPYTKFDELPDYTKFYFRPFDFDYSKFDLNWLLLLDSEIFFNHLSKIPEIKIALEASLRGSFNEKLSEIYGRFFI